MSKKLYKSLKAQKDQTEQVKLIIYGSLGIFLGGQKVVQVANRQGYVYVRLRENQNEVIQAFNNRVASSFGLPVIVIREGGRYVVQQYNSQRYLNNAQNPAPFLPGHGTQHSFPRGGGADITWVYGQQIIPALVYPNPTTGTNVYIDRYPLYTPNNRWIYAGGTGTQNILQYLPTTGSSSLMVLVYMDAYTGNPGILVGSGTYFPANVSGSVYQYIPSPSVNQIPLAGVLLNTGTTTILWSNIYDVRQWVHATPSGTAGGGGGGSGVDTIGFVGQSNGAYLATGTVLNVVGAGATFTVSGTTFNLNIPGGGGGGGVDQIGIFGKNNGVSLATGTILNVAGSRLTLSASGTTLLLTNSPDPAPVFGFYGYSGTTGLGTGTSLSVGNNLNFSITGSTFYLNANNVISSTGWSEVSDTWTFASASTITIPSDGTTVYKKYMKIRFKQGGAYKYYNCGAIAATLLTVIINTDYTVANAAITNVAYSFQQDPYGFPHSFSVDPPTWTNITIGNGTSNQMAYSIQGGMAVMRAGLVFGNTTVMGTSPGLNIPFTSSAKYTASNHIIGLMRLSAAGTAFQGQAVIGASAVNIGITVIDVSATYAKNATVTATVPATWTTADNLEMAATLLLDE